MSLEVSDEPLEIIQANECGDDSLTSSRFRRVFRELDNARQFRQAVADALDALRAELNAEAAYCSEDDSDYDEGVQFALTHLDATRAALKLPAPTAEGESTR